MSSLENDGKQVKVLVKAFDILKAVGDSEDKLSVRKLGAMLDMDRSTVHRICSTLEDLGFLESLDDSGYRLGLALIELGTKALQARPLTREGKTVLTRLSRDTQETCYLSVYDRGMVLYVDVIESPMRVGVRGRVGMRVPPHCTSAGKVFLANVPETELCTLTGQGELRKYLPGTITDPDVLRRELELTRKRGYGLSANEYEPGVCGVAAPVYGATGEIIAALSVAGPVDRLGSARVPEIAGLVMSSARSLSEQMGFAGLRQQVSG